MITESILKQLLNDAGFTLRGLETLSIQPVRGTKR